MVSVQTTASLRCVTNPNDDELNAWWAALQADSMGRKWFSDAFPQTFADFVSVLASGVERCTLFFDSHEHVAGSYWLHDMVDDDPDYPPYAWVRGFVVPTYRGNFTLEAWPVARAIFKAWGYERIFAGSHSENKRAIACLTRNMQFIVVDTFANFCLFDGEPGPCTVCSMRPEDVGLAKRDAQLRSENILFSV